MKKHFTLICIVGLAFNSNSQLSTSILDGNNTRVSLNNTGVFLNNEDGFGSAGYEFPKDSDNHLVFANSFWFGGEDVGGMLKMAAEFYGEGHDLYPGPLTIDGSATAVPGFANEVYTVSRFQIDEHISGVGTPGYVTPDVILNWPAHGDPALGLDYYLAPFGDVDGDGNYEPEEGDHPEIRGDYASYIIMNDKGGLHENSGGDPIGIEIHFMFYQFNGPEMANHTFVNVRIINRGTQTLTNFIVGNYMDADIGFSEDDYMGCDSAKSLMYCYNGDLNDEGAGPQPGYGSDIPAIGVVALNHDANVIGYFDRLTPPYNDPVTAADYWNYMNGNWKNGVSFGYGGNGNTTSSGVPTNYVFSGNPTAGAGEWSEVSEGNPAGDRRMFMASKPTVIEFQDILCFDYAIITNTGATPFESAGGLDEVADEVKTFYNDNTLSGCDATVGLIETPALLEFELFPNPSNGEFTVNKAGEFDLAIYAIDGRLLFTSTNNQETLTVNADLAAGTYIVSLTQDGVSAQSKIIIR